MASSHPKTTSGKIYDPVFLFMLLAIVIAVGTSFLLRAAVAGFGPPTAHAAGPDATPQLDQHMHDVSPTDDGDH